MDSIIEEINKIEEQAVKIVAQANVKKIEMAQNLDKVLAQMDADSQALTDKTVQDIESSKDATLKQHADELKATYDKRMADLTDDYTSNKEKYATEIFNKIIGE